MIHCVLWQLLHLDVNLYNKWYYCIVVKYSEKMSDIMQNYITEQDSWTYFVSLQTDSVWQILRYWYPNVSLFVNVMTISACEALLNCHCLEISKPITRNSIQYAVKRLTIKYCNQYNGVIMSALSSHITISRLFTQPLIQGADQRKQQSFLWLALMRGNLRLPVNPRTKGQLVPAQWASNVENVSTWWHYHDDSKPSDLVLLLSNRFQKWQHFQQPCCRGNRQLLELSDNAKSISQSITKSGDKTLF